MQYSANFSQTPEVFQSKGNPEMSSFEDQIKFVTMIGTERDLPISALCKLPRLFLL